MKEEYNDYELVYLAQEYNEDAINILNDKYLPIIEKLSRSYQTILKNKGLDIYDIKQECLLAFNNSIHSFNEQEQTNFYTFTKACMEKTLISLLRKQTSKKAQILNDALSLDYASDEKEENNLLHYIEGKELDPERIVLNEEIYQNIYQKILENLSYLEESVLILKIQNYNYKEIAKILDKEEKSIDNAIQRIKWKVKKMKQKDF